MVLSLNEFLVWMRSLKTCFARQKENLDALDAILSDGDHGSNMLHGFTMVNEVLSTHSFVTIDRLLRCVGTTLLKTANEASMMLYGTFFLRMGAFFKGRASLPGELFFTGLRGGMAGIQERVEEMTNRTSMMASWLPAMAASKHAWTSSHGDFIITLASVAQAARRGAEALPSHETSRKETLPPDNPIQSYRDPGATSTYWLLRCALLSWSRVSTISPSVESMR